jgi:hypothetical protein
MNFLNGEVDEEMEENLWNYYVWYFQIVPGVKPYLNFFVELDTLASNIPTVI